MSLTLKPYSAYTRGPGWLSSTPNEWSVEPLFVVLRERQERNTGMREKQVLSLSYGRIVKKRDEDLHGLVPASFESYQIVHSGNVILRLTDLQNDQRSLRVGLVNDTGIITSAYLCLEVGPNLLPRFAYYLLHAADVQKLFYGMGAGLRQSIGFAELRRMPVAIPSIDEQKRIVTFLDQHGHTTDKLIRAKRRVIELLNEQKKKIVRHAVTRGIDDSISLKPSGIPWIPEIPEHWDASRVKREFASMNPRRIPLSGTQRGTMTARLYHYYGASGVIDKVDDYLFDDELLLIAEDGANLVLRNLPLAIIARGRFWVNNHAHILKPKTGNLEYLALLMESVDYRPWVSGAAQPKLTLDRLMAIPIPVPSPEEQVKILSWVATKTERLNAALDRAKQQVTLLRDYRTRLTADLVTGKLDVGGVDLPEIGNVEEPDPTADIDIEEEPIAAEEADDGAE